MRRDLSQIAPSLSLRPKAIILGSLLGNGSLRMNDKYKNARFSFQHSAKNKSYFFWKVKELKEISGKNCWWLEKDGKYRYQSQALESLNEIYNFTHKKGKFKVRRKWLNLLTPLSLAVWWCDNGFLIKNSRQGVFCTDRFSLKEQRVLAKYLYKVWGIRVKIGRTKRKGSRFRLFIRSTEMLKKFLRIILPHLPVEEMLPKVILLYRDHQLQERWISEVAQLSRFSKKTVERYLVQKKGQMEKLQRMI